MQEQQKHLGLVSKAGDFIRNAYKSPHTPHPATHKKGFPAEAFFRSGRAGHADYTRLRYSPVRVS
ncbi:MAG TPA: hypothetical protein PLU86_09105, partial [Comamonas denitrificans]|nr:hypothetical protein [Comamonas denitrificans]